MNKGDKKETNTSNLQVSGLAKTIINPYEAYWAVEQGPNDNQNRHPVINFYEKDPDGTTKVVPENPSNLEIRHSKGGIMARVVQMLGIPVNNISVKPKETNEQAAISTIMETTESYNMRALDSSINNRSYSTFNNARLLSSSTNVKHQQAAQDSSYNATAISFPEVSEPHVQTNLSKSDQELLDENDRQIQVYIDAKAEKQERKKNSRRWNDYFKKSYAAPEVSLEESRANQQSSHTAAYAKNVSQRSGGGCNIS